MLGPRHFNGTVKLLLDAGASIKLAKRPHTSPLVIAASYGIVHAMKCMINDATDDQKSLALRMALRYDQLPAAALLIDCRVSINSKGSLHGSPLWAASRHGLNPIRFLLEKQQANGFLVDEGGRNGLHVSALHGDTSVLQFYLDLGLDINARDHRGWSVIHYAALAATADSLNLLLPKWTLGDQDGDHDWSPLHLACVRNSAESLDLLLKMGFVPREVATPELPRRYSFWDVATIFPNSRLISPQGEPMHPLLRQGQDTNGGKQQNLLQDELPRSTKICDGCCPLEVR